MGAAYHSGTAKASDKGAEKRAGAHRSLANKRTA
jgi:hypothetical protein